MSYLNGIQICHQNYNDIKFGGSVSNGTGDNMSIRKFYKCNVLEKKRL